MSYRYRHQVLLVSSQTRASYSFFSGRLSASDALPQRDCAASMAVLNSLRDSWPSLFLSANLRRRTAMRTSMVEAELRFDGQGQCGPHHFADLCVRSGMPVFVQRLLELRRTDEAAPVCVNLRKDVGKVLGRRRCAFRPLGCQCADACDTSDACGEHSARRACEE